VNDWRRRRDTRAARFGRPESVRFVLPVAGAVLIALALALAFVPGPARAATYKWVDDQGVVHYSDQMPPEALNKGNVQLNKQGVPVKKTDAALTPEQRRAREADEERRAQQAKEQEAIARRDRALLSSYTTESEIDLAKSRALATIDTVVKSTAAYSEQLTKRKAEIDAKKASYGDKPAPAALERELEGINAEVARQNDLLALKKREVATAVAKYDADKQRWRELVTAKSAQADAVPAAGPATATK